MDTKAKLLRALREPHETRDGMFFYLTTDELQEVHMEMNSSINVFKTYLKRWSGLYELLRGLLSPGISTIPHLTSAKAPDSVFTKNVRREKLIVSVGSGVKFLAEDIINVDIYPYTWVHVVADATALPFKDASVDMILCEDVLEHIIDPFAAIREFKRVLAPGGFMFITAPFLYPFHSSPNDYLRFTRNALRAQLEGFDIMQEGSRSGPMAALQGVLMHTLAMLFSFGNYSLYLILSNVFMILLSPLKLFDIIFTLFPYAHEASADLFILAKKR